MAERNVAPPDESMAETESPVEQNARPQRTRRPPVRLEYYIPTGYVQSTTVCSMCAQPLQSPYTPASYWPQPGALTYPYMNFPLEGNSY